MFMGKFFADRPTLRGFAIIGLIALVVVLLNLYTAVLAKLSARAKYYRLTAAGLAQLLRERDKWSQLVDAIGRILNPAPAGKE